MVAGVGQNNDLDFFLLDGPPPYNSMGTSGGSGKFGVPMTNLLNIYTYLPC